MSDPTTEAEANYFAMHLLVPSVMLKKAVQDLGGIDLSANDGVIEKLAKQFKVSTNVMAFRIAEDHLLKL